MLFFSETFNYDNYTKKLDALHDYDKKLYIFKYFVMNLYYQYFK